MNYKQTFANLTFGLILCFGFTYSILFKENFVPAFILIAYISFHKFKSEGRVGNLSRVSIISLFIASLVAFIGYNYQYYGPRDWDFTCFFIYGNVAARGMNFYNPSDYYALMKTLSIPIELDSSFMSEVIDVGCPYPPPSLLLISILGFFDYDNALLVWTILNDLFLLGSIILVMNIFFKRKGFEGIMISTILVLAFDSVLTTVYFSQILFILLFFLLLFFKYRDKPLGGLFLAIAIFIKPFAAILFLYLIVKQQKTSILIFFISCLSICLITALVFGINPFLEYFLDNPTHREPEWFFTENTNKSLLAALYRKFPENKLLANIIYYISSVISLLTFGSIIYQNKNNQELYGIFFVIILSVTLIIYPSGQLYYLVVHIISILILLTFIRKMEISAILIYLFYLVSYEGLFYVNIFLLIISVIIIYHKRIDFIYDEIIDSIKIGA